MFAVFDYSDSHKGWVRFDTYDAAKSHMTNLMEEYWLMDKDNWCDCMFEIYNDGEHEVWVIECGAWYGCNDEDGPHKLIYHGSRSDFPSHKFVSRHPRQDYISI